MDTSALLKRYIDEPDSALADELLGSDQELATGRHTVVELRRNLARMLSGTALAFIAFDVRQSQIAQTLGFRVSGGS